MSPGSKMVSPQVWKSNRRGFSTQKCYLMATFMLDKDPRWHYYSNKTSRIIDMVESRGSGIYLSTKMVSPWRWKRKKSQVNHPKLHLWQKGHGNFESGSYLIPEHLIPGYLIPDTWLRGHLIPGTFNALAFHNLKLQNLSWLGVPIPTEFRERRNIETNSAQPKNNKTSL